MKREETQIMGINLWKGVHVVCAVLVCSTGLLAQQDVCGRTPLNSKIVGGASAAPGSWPWQVSFQTGNSHFCGGSLINENWVLSAAHCFQSVNTSDITVYLGMDSVKMTKPYIQKIGAIIKHKGFADKAITFLNDIALVQLSSSVTFDNYLKPVCLAASNSFFPGGTKVWITGYGQIGNDVSLPSLPTLQEVKVPIVSNSDCAQLYGSGSITDNMVCAGLAEGGKDSCQGDSGGPLMIKHNTVWVQAGIVSFGYGCGEPNYPGVYTRVSKYQDWITSSISSNKPGFVQISNSSVSYFFYLFLFLMILICWKIFKFRSYLALLLTLLKAKKLGQQFIQ